jgi:hypothetical protein
MYVIAVHTLCRISFGLPSKLIQALLQVRSKKKMVAK